MALCPQCGAQLPEDFGDFADDECHHCAWQPDDEGPAIGPWPSLREQQIRALPSDSEVTS